MEFIFQEKKIIIGRSNILVSFHAHPVGVVSSRSAYPIFLPYVMFIYLICKRSIGPIRCGRSVILLGRHVRVTLYIPYGGIELEQHSSFETYKTSSDAKC